MSQERITIDSSLFGPAPGSDPDVEMTSVAIRCERTDLAALALARAAVRFQYVDETGHEMLDDDEMEANDDLESPRQTPNWTSAVSRTPEGPEVTIDFKGRLTADMKPTLARIVSEELAVVGVSEATLMSVLETDRSDEPWFSAPDDTAALGRIGVDFSLFWPVYEDLRNGTTINVIVESENPEAVARALARAAQRFTRLTIDGSELDDADSSSEGMFEIIGPIYRTPSGPRITLDRGAYLPTLMGQAMVRILREELRAVDVHEATLRSGFMYDISKPWSDAPTPE